MTGDPVPGLTLILAWRDNEVDGHHPVGQLLERVQRAGRPPLRVAVGPLDAQGLGGVVAAMLGAPPDSLVELSTIVCEKSGGNPYFAQEFLRRLVADGDLCYRNRDGGWRWDAERLRARQVTANVRDLVAARIAELPPEQADLLSAAACIGHSFDLDVVAAATVSAARRWPGICAASSWAASWWQTMGMGLCASFTTGFKRRPAPVCRRSDGGPCTGPSACTCWVRTARSLPTTPCSPSPPTSRSCRATPSIPACAPCACAWSRPRRGGRWRRRPLSVPTCTSQPPCPC